MRQRSDDKVSVPVVLRARVAGEEQLCECSVVLQLCDAQQPTRRVDEVGSQIELCERLAAAQVLHLRALPQVTRQDTPPRALLAHLLHVVKRQVQILQLFQLVQILCVSRVSAAGSKACSSAKQLAYAPDDVVLQIQDAQVPADLAQELDLLKVLAVQRELLSRRGAFSAQATELTSRCDAPPAWQRCRCCAPRDGG